MKNDIKITGTNAAAQREYQIGLAISMVIYAGLCFGVPELISGIGAHGPLLLVLAVSPAVPIIAFFFVFARYLMRVDEYQRHRVVQVLLVALAIVLAVSTAWDFLCVYANVAPPPAFIFTPGFIATFGLVQGAFKIAELWGRRS